MKVLNDPYGRKFKTLRVSLLNTCNLNCFYCTMGSEEDVVFDHRLQKSAAFFSGIISRLHEQLDLETIRLTGGEPLLYRELPELIRNLTLIGIPKITMTSNGYLLSRQAAALKTAGLQAINVSLDAVNEAVFFKMAKRRHLDKVLNGIEAAINEGIQVKLNAVIMKGMNEDEIIPLVDYAFSKNIPVRFLEVMSMGHLHHESDKYLFSQQQLLDTIATKYNFKRMPRATSATANYWQTAEGNTFGIIANNSEPFCQDCSRLRLDADGNMYGCLSTNHPIAMDSNDNDYVLQEKLQLAMNQKQLHHFVGSELSMLNIGG
ncbi:GTP 3',8-cyclase MoaA [Mucilaginibacter arboris]|uniref:GTP 3',8-cyclase n=1 Tax=Mucilaginibacter arboris TaxID=2682090 RepID=A0A7K1SX48_9SPHI|nr:radical SAM protein [Mucilaginibacter arboris]MVN21807.1 radical SAM protein [Mucilaginibacter arboris]